MDSKDVNQAIRAVIRPFLKEQGFDRSMARWDWRHQEHKIDCIRCWSPYNWVEAEIKGITTFSFQIGMGIYFVDIPRKVLAQMRRVDVCCPKTTSVTCGVGYRSRLSIQSHRCHSFGTSIRMGSTWKR
jgi:hypothetical protein